MLLLILLPKLKCKQSLSHYCTKSRVQLNVNNVYLQPTILWKVDTTIKLFLELLQYDSAGNQNMAIQYYN